MEYHWLAFFLLLVALIVATALLYMALLKVDEDDFDNSSLVEDYMYPALVSMSSLSVAMLIVFVLKITGMHSVIPGFDKVFYIKGKHHEGHSHKKETKKRKSSTKSK